MRNIEEQHLLKKAAAGDMAAFEQLVIKYQAQVYNLALRMTGNPDDAADMAQEAFLRAWRGLNKFQFESSFSTWLYRLTSNVCIDFLRNAKRHQTIPLTYTDTDGEEQTLELADDAPLPEETAIIAEQQAQIIAAMAQLEPEHRQILTLRVVNDLSYSDIAAILQVKEGTVKSRLARARENLKKKLLQIGNKSKTTPSKSLKGGQELEM